MKRTIALLVALCCLLAVAPVLAESGTVTANTTVTFDGFSFIQAAGSNLQRGETGDVVSFVYYPAFASGDAATNVTGTWDTMIEQNLATETDAYRTAYANNFVDQIGEIYKSMGIDVGSMNWSWSDPITVDGRPGAVFRLDLTLTAFGMTMDMVEYQAVFNVGSYRYFFTSSADTAEQAEAALADVLNTLTWN